MATKGRFKFPGKRPQSVIPCANVPASKRLHSTEKPQGVLRELVRALCPPGGSVIDPCMGSGSCAVAAQAEARRFVGIELDPDNFKTASARVKCR